MDGSVAQSVEQRTENPCVGGSIPPEATLKPHQTMGFFGLYSLFYEHENFNSLLYKQRS